MISKFFQPAIKSNILVLKHIIPIISHTISARSIFGLVPPNQYDMPRSKKLKLGYVLKNHWETIPLFVTTVIAMSVVFASIVWTCKNKVDLVFTPHNRGNISRTMDLRNPTTHKIITINQCYEPWPEMQDVLDKMAAAEKRALARLQNCN